ncbi:tryptophanyl-tRNA synthetase [Exidia glandulosa HHB12029]|uniref:Tryptophan--tRNA ligase, mitochondrial n=1 Tax=Exidia glandulosa HHB12029 TaxID=1314781 RepID=A0A165EG66_EXIGL|nr:tryptophanyl-tRNA synthetase [Exidia glandulosa HHB12029]
MLLRVLRATRPLLASRSPFSTARPKTVFSGIQPTGIPHLGNYLGALKNWVELQNSASADDTLIYSVVGLHAFTIPPGDPDSLRQSKLDAAASLIAIGIDPARCILFHQDEVPEHAELAWILNCLTPVGRLRRMTTWKAKLATVKNATSLDDVDETDLSLGLFAYPVLQAADVLLYKATHVPVGEDQLQHIELMRDIASTFNGRYSPPKTPFFPVPEAVAPSATKRIRALRDPEHKMSKSSPSANSRILLTDSPESITSKIRSAVTDSTRHLTYEPETRPGVANLMDILSACTGETIDDVVRRMDGKGHSDLKAATAEAVIAMWQKPREEFERVRSDEEELRRVMWGGAERAREIASRTLAETKRLIGLA